MMEREAIRAWLAANPHMHALLQKKIESGTIQAADFKQEEPVLVACGIDHLGVAGMKQVSCAFCTRPAWMARSTQEMIAEKQLQPTFICVRCLVTQMRRQFKEAEGKPC